MRHKSWMAVCTALLLGPLFNFAAWSQPTPLLTANGGQAVSVAPGSADTVQVPAGQSAAIIAPRLVRFSGIVKDPAGQPRSGVVGATFAIYKEQEGGAPLWMETQ